jgi:site-specific recombinase XerD
MNHPHQPPETITEDEFQSLEKSANILSNHLWLLLMYDAGLRVGEVSTLCFEDIAYEKVLLNSVRVRRENSKTKTERFIPMTVRLHAAFEFMLDDCTSEPTAGTFQPLFPGCAGRTFITTRRIQSFVTQISLEVLHRPIHPHTLRHSFATKHMRTAPIKVVAMMMGHKNISTTSIYQHPDKTDCQKAIQAGENPQ